MNLSLKRDLASDCPFQEFPEIHRVCHTHHCVRLLILNNACTANYVTNKPYPFILCMLPYSSDYIFTLITITIIKAPCVSILLRCTLLIYSLMSFSLDILSVVVEPFIYF